MLFETVTHDLLVNVAREWLRKTKKCSVVVSEIQAAGMESPDALGWYDATSHLVEVKISRADFFADRKKIFRQDNARGMGDFRWFLTPSGLVRPDELPEGFGLIEWEPSRRRAVQVVREAVRQAAKGDRYETYVLLSLIRRLGQQSPEGCSIRCYTYETKNRAAADIAV